MPDIRLLELRNTYTWGGGPDKTILLSAERHNKEKVSVVVAYIRDAGTKEFVIGRKAKERGITYHEIEERGKFDFRVLRAIRDLVKKYNINLIHGHEYKSDLYAYLVRLSLWQRDIALVSTAHAWVMLGVKGALYRRLDLALMKRFDHLLAVSHATNQEMLAAGVPSSKITVIHNAIDTQAWGPRQQSSSLRMELGLDDAFPVIGYVGRIDPEKDLETWLKAAAMVGRQYSRARFVLVGTGRDSNLRDSLSSLAAQLGIADQVVFLGYRDNLQPVYASFDMFMLTSRREGLPNCILEAMAMGLPVVTTDVAGAKELVINGATGFVLPQGDVEGLGNALLQVAGDGSLRERLGKSGRERIEQDFCFMRRLSRVEELYGRFVRRQNVAAEPLSTSTSL